MKVKFLGATEAEDRVVDVPDGTTMVEVELPKPEVRGNPWAAAAILLAGMATLIVITWLITRG